MSIVLHFVLIILKENDNISFMMLVVADKFPFYCEKSTNFTLK